MLRANKKIIALFFLLPLACLVKAQKKTADSLINSTSCRGLNGSLYKASLYPHSIAVQQSNNAGKTWSSYILACPVKNGALCEMDGVKLRSPLNLLCDTGSGPYRGRIYLCWSDEKFGAGHSDVFLAYSDDEAQHFTEPILLTYNPNHSARCWPAMHVRPGDGRIYVAYFDKQNYYQSRGADIYLSLSDNGGLQFSACKLNTQSALIAPGSGISITRMADKAPELRWSVPLQKPSTVKIIVSDSLLRAAQASAMMDEPLMEKTFVFADTIRVPFTAAAPLSITAVLTKPLDPGFSKLVFKNKAFGAGKNTLQFEPKKMGLIPGNYTLILYYKNKNRFVWITHEN